MSLFFVCGDRAELFDGCCYAESEVLEEVICDLQLLLGEEDRGTYGYLFPLLLGASSDRFDSRS